MVGAFTSLATRSLDKLSLGSGVEPQPQKRFGEFLVA